MAEEGKVIIFYTLAPCCYLKIPVCFLLAELWSCAGWNHRNIPFRGARKSRRQVCDQMVEHW